MSARAGEIARENAPYRCCDCGQAVMVYSGCPISECPHCGSASFHTGWRTLENQAPAPVPYPAVSSFP